MLLQDRILAAFRQRFGTDPEFIACAPGRVNLLGEHVDYNQGFVLPAAIDRFTLVAFRKSSTSHSSILAMDLGEETSFNRISAASKSDPTGAPLSGWARYPAGVMVTLEAAGLDVPGLQAVIGSDVPLGAGLSSSASVELAFAVAWESLGGWKLPPLQLARLCQKAEVNYVGVNCGIMDQFASACGVKDRLLFLDCRSLEWRAVSLPGNSVMVIADTSIRRALSESMYNDRRLTCEHVVSLLQHFLPGIKSLRDVNLDQFNQYADQLPDIPAKRARHVIEEIARTEKAQGLLEQGDTAQFGELMDACHASLRDLYEVSCAELDTMVALARALPGCYGARLTGAGFGGCTVNLVAAQEAEDFARHLASAYETKTRIQPQVYICHAAEGARSAMV